jgi:hypothetical protein
MAPAEHGEIRERGGPALGPVADVMALAERTAARSLGTDNHRRGGAARAVSPGEWSACERRLPRLCRPDRLASSLGSRRTPDGATFPRRRACRPRARTVRAPPGPPAPRRRRGRRPDSAHPACRDRYPASGGIREQSQRVGLLLGHRGRFRGGNYPFDKTGWDVPPLSGGTRLGAIVHAGHVLPNGDLLSTVRVWASHAHHSALTLDGLLGYRPPELLRRPNETAIAASELTVRHLVYSPLLLRPLLRRPGRPPLRRGGLRRLGGRGDAQDGGQGIGGRERVPANGLGAAWHGERIPQGPAFRVP